MKSWFPIFFWLPRYRWSDLRYDCIAGVTVAVMLIPQGMAYALLAGLPPVTGLYAGMISLIIYTLMGTSRHLSVGPVAIDSLLIAAGIGLLARPGTPDYVTLAMLTAVMVGIVQFLMGIARLGYVINFLSQPVLSGFISAAAVIIAFSQLKYILGVPVPRSQDILEAARFVVVNLPDVHLPSMVIGIGAVVMLLVLRRRVPSLPGPLLVAGLATGAVYGFDLATLGVQTVGEIPGKLPRPMLPPLSWSWFNQLLPLALTVALLSFMEAIAIAKKFAAPNRFSVDSNQELRGLGMANVFSGIFGGYSVSASLTRTAVNAHAGARTPLASLINAGIVGLTLLYLTPVFFYLPLAVLAAIIIVAVSGMIDVREARRLFRVKKSDFWVMIIAFLATLLLGVQNGILLSVAASVLMIFQRIAHPHVALMGRIPRTGIIRNFKRDSRAEPIEGLVILRIDASLYFANISYLKDRIQESISQREDIIRAVIIDASSINEIDSSAESALEILIDELRALDIDLYFTNVKGPVRDMMARTGFHDRLGGDHFFLSKRDAVRHYLNLRLREMKAAIEEES